MSDCIFCNIVDGETPSNTVYEDDKILVFKDIAPKAPVHLLMIPKIHIQSLAHTTSSDSELMGHMLTKVPEIAKLTGLVDGFRTIINTGRDGGQIVFHIHIHILGGGGPLPF